MAVAFDTAAVAGTHRAFDPTAASDTDKAFAASLDTDRASANLLENLQDRKDG